MTPEGPATKAPSEFHPLKSSRMGAEGSDCGYSVFCIAERYLLHFFKHSIARIDSFISGTEVIIAFLQGAPVASTVN